MGFRKHYTQLKFSVLNVFKGPEVVKIQKCILCFTFILVILKQFHVGEKHHTVWNMDAHEIQLMLLKERLFPELTYQDYGKHTGMYKNWFRVDSKGKMFVTDKGKCTGYFSYNHTVGNEIALDRDIPVTRPGDCSERYDNIDLKSLPKASVVIPFHNEPLSTLMRTLLGVIRRTPPELLEEIVLVNDGSTADMGCLKEEFEKAIYSLGGKVKLVHTVIREGSTRARIIGAAYAKAEVISYLDSHVEVSVGWMQPILSRIKHNKKSVVMSILDTISDEDFRIRGSWSNSHGGFKWTLDFFWKNLTPRVKKMKSRDSDPYPSPIMPAGAFALNKEFFTHIGLLDTDMKIWGVDDVEFSFRAWQCGAYVEIVPCSRVGHIFRKHIPYSFQDSSARKVVYHNAVRTAEVTLEGYKKFFYAQSNPQYNVTVNVTSLRERKDLKRMIGCKDLKWFMKNVIPEMPLPPQESVYYEFSKSWHDNACITMENKALFARDCRVLDRSQYFYTTAKEQLKNWNYCVGVHREKNEVALVKCNDSDFVTRILYKNFRFFLHGRNLCLYMHEDKRIIAKECLDENRQKWTFTYHFDWSKPLSYPGVL